MLIDLADFEKGLRCPVSKEPLYNLSVTAHQYATKAGYPTYPVLNEMPVLIDFDSSLADSSYYNQHTAKAYVKRRKYSGLSLVAKQLVDRVKKSTKENTKHFFDLAMECDNPRVLIVGGGSIGNGMHIFYESEKIQLISFDIYDTGNIQLIADAHQIPFVDGFFDGVIVQAVLEHVIEPQIVVNENL